MTLKTILLVEGLDSHRVMLKWTLANYSYIVDIVSNAEDALSVFDPVIHDLVITDQQVGTITGTELAHIIKMRAPRTPVLLFSEEPPDAGSCFDAYHKKARKGLWEEDILRLKETLDRLLDDHFSGNPR